MLQCQRCGSSFWVQKIVAKNAEIASKNSEIFAKNAEIATKNKEINSKNEEIAAKVRELSEKDLELATKTAELAAKNTELAKFKEKFAIEDLANFSILNNNIIESSNTPIKESNYNVSNDSDYQTEIINEVGLKSSNDIPVDNSQNITKYLSSEPINFAKIPEQISKNIIPDDALNGLKHFVECIYRSILQDPNGNSKIVCSNISQGIFNYKENKSNEVITDPMLKSLRKKLRSGIIHAEIMKEVENELNARWADDNEIWSKEYDRATRILKLDKNFIRKLAQKTYCKELNR